MPPMGLFRGLTPPAPGRLTIYVLGPGVGESVVAALPDGQWLVVDSCAGGGADSLPLELLLEFGATRIGLVVWSHPDRDHYAGLDALLDALPVDKLWRYPALSTLRETLTAVLRAGAPSTDKRLMALDRVLERVNKLEDGNVGWPMHYSTEVWPRGGSYSVSPVAPLQRDIRRAQKQFQELIVWGPEPRLAQQCVDYLTGKRRDLWDHPNVVSLAVSITFGANRVLLAGDVENGDGSDDSGWPGILTLLSREGRTDIIRDLSAIKVAHHGSAGAWHGPAWSLHAGGRKVPYAVIAPFSISELPREDMLGKMKPFIANLGLTSASPIPRAASAGWTPVGTARGVGCIRLEFDDAGLTSASAFGEGTLCA